MRGCERAVACGRAADKVIKRLSATKLVAWESRLDVDQIEHAQRESVAYDLNRGRQEHPDTLCQQLLD